MSVEHEKSVYSPNITIVGLGQTGGMMIETFSTNDKLNVSGVGREYQLEEMIGRFPQVKFRDDLNPDQMGKSDIVVLSVGRNGLIGVLDEMGNSLDGSAEQPIVVLSQNGVLAMDDDLNEVKWQGANWVRESIFTAVSRGEQSELIYNPEKLKISLAQMHGRGESDVGQIFYDSGFRVQHLESYEAMEMTKLLLNLIGTTGIITGMNLVETFNDPELFEVEVRAFRERLVLMQAAGLDVQNFGTLSIHSKLLAGIFNHTPMFVLKQMRGKLAELIAGERGHSLSSAATQINQGKKPVELDYYHMPFIQMAETYGMSAKIDTNIHLLASKQFADLKDETQDQRKQFLLGLVGMS